MNLIFISPNYPAGHWKYVSALCNAGVNVLGIGDAGYETFPAILKGSMTEYYRVGDIHDYNAVYRACAFFIHKYGRIDSIESLNPYWRDLEAKLRFDYHIVGVDINKLKVVLDRKRSYLCAERGGGQTVPYKIVSTESGTKLFAKHYGYPLKALPVFDKRLPIMNINSDDELDLLLSKVEKNSYMLRFVPKGEYVSCDGICDAEDNMIFCAASQFSQPVDKIVSDKNLMSFCTVLGDNKINEMCQNILKAYNQGKGFFHFDFVRLFDDTDSDSEYLLINAEFNPPAEYVADAISCVCGNSVYNIWAKMMIGDELECEMPEQGFVGVASRRFDRTFVNSHEDILNRLGASLYDHRYNDDIIRDVAGEYTYIFRDSTIDEIKRHISFIQEQ